MTIYDVTAELEFSVYADDSYDAMEKLEEKIKNGTVSPENITLSERKGDKDG